MTYVRATGTFVVDLDLHKSVAGLKCTFIEYLSLFLPQYALLTSSQEIEPGEATFSGIEGHGIENPCIYELSVIGSVHGIL